MTKRNFQFVFLAVISFTPLLISVRGLYEVKVIQNKLSEITANIKVLGDSTDKDSPEEPEYIWIPSINVSAKIQNLGVMASGEMEVPSNIVDVGWFNLGPRPGEIGSAVIAGHLDGKNGEAGVFADLDKLKTGDKLYIRDTKGEMIIFVVKESRDYDPGFADEVFSANDGVYLNLITCDGVWNKNKNSYSKRLVVFTDEE